MNPLGCLPPGEDRGSLSKQLIRGNESQENRISTEPDYDKNLAEKPPHD
jgi:hypothetical protein